MKFIKAISFVIQFSLIGLGIAALYVLWQADNISSDIFGRDDQTHASTTTGSTVNSYADAVASSSASVVTIYTSKIINRKPHPLLSDPVFKEFFGDQLKRRQRSEAQTNLGSGVIVSHDGYIITNQHVINGADEILVSLPDGRGSQATLVGEDRETDLAVLRIPVSGLSPIKIAENQPIRVGDVVLAIGNPLNVGQTVTMGNNTKWSANQNSIPCVHGR